MKFLASQPLLATNGPDNSLKIWIFDQPDGSDRLLSLGVNILSAGLDRSLRFISTVRDARSCELSQGSLTKKSKSRGVQMEELKLAPIIDFSSEDARQSAWDNIVTCHQGDKVARTWSFQKKCIGKHHLKSHADVDKAGPVMVCKCSVLLFRRKNNWIITHATSLCLCGTRGLDKVPPDYSVLG
ncbi:WD repeat-containing protein 36 [Desmophyllum pertusum]|uniref:WD repeat-containing protein 36 n=1 Tax=Desmophyllum pertusum TaxID=174260 RepID=A0A9X0CL40_9CNID|nr:WD repeat-containing protein 36 [Desmophyllum pertusum]